MRSDAAYFGLCTVRYCLSYTRQCNGTTKYLKWIVSCSVTPSAHNRSSIIVISFRSSVSNSQHSTASAPIPFRKRCKTVTFQHNAHGRLDATRALIRKSATRAYVQSSELDITPRVDMNISGTMCHGQGRNLRSGGHKLVCTLGNLLFFARYSAVNLWGGRRRRREA